MVPGRVTTRGTVGRREGREEVGNMKEGFTGGSLKFCEGREDKYRVVKRIRKLWERYKFR